MQFCEQCHKPEQVCVCALMQPFQTQCRILILQHPQEQDRLLGTVPLLKAALPQAQVRVGLSFASLAHAWGQPMAPSETWGVLYPHSLQKPLPPYAQKAPCVLLAKQGDVLYPNVNLTPPSLSGFIVLDGTWSQGKALWWRNPWLLKLQRILLHPQEPSIYGRLRKEPNNTCLSTLEAVAEVLHALEENPDIRTHLRQKMRTMVQRIRDANLLLK